MVMEYWTGWFDVWGDLHHVLAPEGKIPCMIQICWYVACDAKLIVYLASFDDVTVVQTWCRRCGKC